MQDEAQRLARRRRPGLRAAATLAMALAVSPSGADPGRQAEPVDLVLLLAVDISLSMSPEELKIQRDGYAEAITSASVLDAIRGGAIGRIAVGYVEWAGEDEQRMIAGWSVIDGDSSAQAFAARLLAAPRRRHFYRTSISNALRYAARQIDRSGFGPTRRVIDISGDGPNNEGEAIVEARNAVVAQSITINGLPLVMNQPIEQVDAVGGIDDYYADCVIGGPGAFTIPVTSIEQFKESVRAKLLAEIAGLSGETAPGADRAAAPITVAARAGRARVDCKAAEELWRGRYDR